MTVFHLHDKVKIHWDENSNDNPQEDVGIIVRVSKSDKIEFILHRIRLLSGREISMSPDNLSLITED